jgi:hypothetical protein
VGRAPEQVSEFLVENIDPILIRYQSEIAARTVSQLKV